MSAPPSKPPRPIRECIACGARLTFRTQAGKEHAAQNPIQVDPGPADKNNVLLDDDGQHYHLVKPGDGTHISHYATCPKRTQFGKKAQRF